MEYIMAKKELQEDLKSWILFAMMSCYVTILILAFIWVLISLWCCCFFKLLSSAVWTDWLRNPSWSGLWRTWRSVASATSSSRETRRPASAEVTATRSSIPSRTRKTWSKRYVLWIVRWKSTEKESSSTIPESHMRACKSFVFDQRCPGDVQVIWIRSYGRSDDTLNIFFFVGRFRFKWKKLLQRDGGCYYRVQELLSL